MAAAKNWNAHDAFANSAAVSFYTLFSLGPITVIVLSVAGFFFGKDIATKQFASQMDQLVGKASAEMIQKTMSSTQPQVQGWASTAVAVAVLIVGATTVFGQLQSSLNQIWDVRAKPSKSGWLLMIITRLVSFAMVITLALLLLVSLILTTALTALVKVASGAISIPPQVLQVADFVIALLVITVLFALVFKIMPDVRVPWGEVWRGSLVTAVLFSIGRILIALYLGHSTVASVYGTAGSLVALLVWVYYSSAILFYGAAFVRADCGAKKLDVPPKSTAVRVRQEVMENA
jgi:membrane protein